jgi:hypothetical protein
VSGSPSGIRAEAERLSGSRPGAVRSTFRCEPLGCGLSSFNQGSSRAAAVSSLVSPRGCSAATSTTLALGSEARQLGPTRATTCIPTETPVSLERRSIFPPVSVSIPADRLFVIGENRFDAIDSRYFGVITLKPSPAARSDGVRIVRAMRQRVSVVARLFSSRPAPQLPPRLRVASRSSRSCRIDHIARSREPRRCGQTLRVVTRSGPSSMHNRRPAALKGCLTQQTADIDFVIRQSPNRIGESQHQRLQSRNHETPNRKML